MYRPKIWKEREREQERHVKKLNWYKKGNMKSVMFIPYTPDSTLPIFERAGISWKCQLQKSEPFVGKNCGRNNCFPCISGGKGSCRSVGINYSIYCCECEQEDGEIIIIIKFTYWRQWFSLGCSHCLLYQVCSTVVAGTPSY